MNIQLSHEGSAIILKLQGKFDFESNPEFRAKSKEAVELTGSEIQVDLAGVDYPDRTPRFEVVVHLMSLDRGYRLRIKARVGDPSGDNAELDSLSDLWAAANWLEREAWDMFGIRFEGHPDLRRILMPEEWQGHPQRKDYPLEGPGELILESPQEWLKLRQSFNEAEIE